MATPTERIESLLFCLNDKDKEFADKFIKSRDFESLRDLVNSALYKEKKKAKQNNVDILSDNTIAIMETLFSEINEYCIILGEDVDYESDFGDEEEEVEEYD